MLELKELRKTFLPGTANAHTALDRLSLTLEAGEFVTVIGSNGAGKSTLFGAVAGEFPLDGGSITLEGRELGGLPEYKRAAFIGRLFQDPMRGTAPHMTIQENLALAYSRSKRFCLGPGVSKKEQRFFRDQLAAFEMGLEDRMHTQAGLLSGGQRQALTLLMSTIGKPGLLLLDEHTAALDPATAQKVMDVTKRIIRENRLTAMMITHNISAALETGTRTIMLDKGRVVLDLSAEKRAGMTLEQLLALYSETSRRQLDNDRMLFSSVRPPLEGAPAANRA